ncbi:glycosyltransferase [Myxacorys almedinensis A]|uniref:Glycosyltransferase n=1 Tax=Myxacorys almedinensis A TaxID=2690445 RepID=A0A8J8CJH6_9CYAN|nr:glycosyltransferase [Myxacorys almedinensis A]
MSNLISIVITTYNRERFLAAAIESVLSQTYQKFELLIWDDGSTDGSVSLIRNYARNRRVQIVTAPHQGRVPALKAAIAQTKGTYLGWIDSDDWLAPTALAETATVLEQYPEIGLVYTDHILVDRKGTVLGNGQCHQIPYARNRLLFDFMTFHFRLMRRTAFEQAGGIDQSLDYAEDYDLCLRLSEVTDVWHVAQPLYYYRRHPENMTVQYQWELSLASQAAIARAVKRRGLTDWFEGEGQFLQGRWQQQKGANKSAAKRVNWLLGIE